MVTVTSPPTFTNRNHLVITVLCKCCSQVVTRLTVPFKKGILTKLKNRLINHLENCEENEDKEAWIRNLKERASVKMEPVKQYVGISCIFILVFLEVKNGALVKKHFEIPLDDGDAAPKVNVLCVGLNAEKHCHVFVPLAIVVNSISEFKSGGAIHDHIGGTPGVDCFLTALGIITGAKLSGDTVGRLSKAFQLIENENKSESDVDWMHSFHPVQSPHPQDVGFNESGPESEWGVGVEREVQMRDETSAKSDYMYSHGGQKSPANVGHAAGVDNSNAVANDHHDVTGLSQTQMYPCGERENMSGSRRSEESHSVSTHSVPHGYNHDVYNNGPRPPTNAHGPTGVHSKEPLDVHFQRYQNALAHHDQATVGSAAPGGGGSIGCTAGHHSSSILSHGCYNSVREYLRRIFCLTFL